MTLAVFEKKLKFWIFKKKEKNVWMVDYWGNPNNISFTGNLITPQDDFFFIMLNSECSFLWLFYKINFGHLSYLHYECTFWMHNSSLRFNTLPIVRLEGPTFSTTRAIDSTRQTILSLQWFVSSFQDVRWPKYFLFFHAKRCFTKLEANDKQSPYLHSFKFYFIFN